MMVRRNQAIFCFASDDQAAAQEVLDKINSGELDFADAAQQYSQDEGYKADGGNVGWDKLTSFVDEYQTALDGLEKDQVSALVTSTYGIHIIKCTDVFTAPDEVTSIDQIPSEFSDSIKQSPGFEQNQSYSAGTRAAKNPPRSRPPICRAVSPTM